jgi:DNA-directed RNA polymerase subunit RPC12/RpoP
MLATLEGTGFPLWALVVFPVAVAAQWAFHTRIRKAELKRRWFPWTIALTAVLGSALFHSAGVRSGGWLILGPVSLLILVAHLYSTRFCSACGASVFGTREQLRPTTCHACGSELIDRPRG